VELALDYLSTELEKIYHFLTLKNVKLTKALTVQLEHYHWQCSAMW